MNESSLIPDEYVADRLEVRRTIVGVVLFVVVMICVVGAFFVTNRQWDAVRTRQAEVKIQYDDVSSKIVRMESLRSSRDDLVERAELASALVSRVPRSYLLAGLVERMPPRVSWTSMTLKSKEIQDVVERTSPSADRLKSRGPAPAPVRTRGPGAANAGDEEGLKPKHYRTSVILTGLAPDEVDVSMYVAALQDFDLLESVMPDSTEVIEINDVPMRKFTLTMSINTKVEDAFEVEQVGGEDSIASQLDVTDRVVTAGEREEN
jgi:hypothetical protein